MLNLLRRETFKTLLVAATVLGIGGSIAMGLCRCRLARARRARDLARRVISASCVKGPG